MSRDHAADFLANAVHASTEHAAQILDNVEAVLGTMLTDEQVNQIRRRRVDEQGRHFIAAKKQRPDCWYGSR